MFNKMTLKNQIMKVSQTELLQFGNNKNAKCFATYCVFKI